MPDKKILLVSPPFYRLLGSHYNGINLGLGYISTVLNQNGFQCSIYNADYVDSEYYQDQLGLIAGYDEYKRTIANINHTIWGECVQNILNYKPDFVGFSMFTANFPAVNNISLLLKQKSPDIKIVVGGSHVTLAKEIVLEEAESVDFAIYGEGEYAFLELVRGKSLEDIDGLIYRNNGKIVINKERTFIKNLDTLPFPQRTNFYPSIQKLKAHYIITSRGCPNNCSFCASPILWKRKVRFRSIDNVIAELRGLKDQGFSYIQFQDDTFTFNKKRLLVLLDKMIQEKMNFSWTCDTRLNCIDAEVLKKMTEAGCIRVKVGIESGNRDILKEINKGITPELVMEKIKLIKEYGLNITTYFMIGFPEETDQQARETVELAKKIEADYYSLSILAPYYGTSIYDDFIRSNNGKETKKHWEYFYHQSKDMIMNTNISPDVIDEFLSLNEYGKGHRI